MRGKKCNECKKVVTQKISEGEHPHHVFVSVCVEPSLVPHGHLPVNRGWGYSYNYSYYQDIPNDQPVWSHSLLGSRMCNVIHIPTPEKSASLLYLQIK